MRVFKWSEYAALLYTRSNCESLCQLVSADDLGLALLDSIPRCHRMCHNVSFVETMEGFFKVYKVDIDCAVPFPHLLKDLPESEYVVTAGSPFAEASLLFSNVRIHGSSQALLYDLTENFACEI